MRLCLRGRIFFPTLNQKTGRRDEVASINFTLQFRNFTGAKSARRALRRAEAQRLHLSIRKVRSRSEKSDLNDVHDWASWGAATLRPCGLLLEVDGFTGGCGLAGGIENFSDD
jgi:hypothetical protein